MEKQFKLDIHVHTSETSSCGQVSAQEAVRLYEQADMMGLLLRTITTGSILTVLVI